MKSVQDVNDSYLPPQKQITVNDCCMNQKNCKIDMERKITFYVPSSYNLAVQNKLDSCQNNRVESGCIHKMFGLDVLVIAFKRHFAEKKWPIIGNFLWENYIQHTLHVQLGDVYNSNSHVILLLRSLFKIPCLILISFTRVRYVSSVARVCASGHDRAQERPTEKVWLKQRPNTKCI